MFLKRSFKIPLLKYCLTKKLLYFWRQNYNLKVKQKHHYLSMNNNENVPFEAEKKYDQPFDLVGESKQFGCRIVNVYQYLTEKAERKEYILSKELMKKGTAIGDLVRQEEPLAAFHAASSARYNLELLVHGGYLTESQSNQLMEDCIRLVKYLYVVSHPESRKQKEAREGMTADKEPLRLSKTE